MAVNRSQEKMTAQKPGKNDCTKARKKGFLWTSMNHISNITFNFSQKKIAIKNVLRYKHKINSENKSIDFAEMVTQKYQLIKCQMVKNRDKKMYAKQLGQLHFFKNIIQFYNKVNFKV